MNKQVQFGDLRVAIVEQVELISEDCSNGKPTVLFLDVFGLAHLPPMQGPLKTTYVGR